MIQDEQVEKTSEVGSWDKVDVSVDSHDTHVVKSNQRESITSFLASRL